MLQLCKAATGLIVALFAFVPGLRAQTAFPSPQPEVQWLDSTGAPLAGGKLCTYLAGTNVPQATYTDSTALVANSNPVILDSAGRASIWITNTALYKYVLRSGGDGTCTTGSILWTQDNIGTTAGGGSGTSTAIIVQQSSGGATGNGGYIHLKPVTYPGTSCFDVYGNPVNQPSPVSGDSFGTNDAVMWVSESPLAGTSPPGCAVAFNPNEIFGLNLNMYMFAMGGYATDITSYNAFDALQGGMHAFSFSANHYVNAGHYAGTPPLTTNDAFHQGAIYWDDTAHCLMVANESLTFSCISGGGGGGSPGGVTDSIQIRTSGGLFGGDANLLYSTSSNIVTLIGAGYIDSHGGYRTDSTNIDSIQSPAGGVTGKYVVATDSLFWIQEAAPALSASGQTRAYMDSTSHWPNASINGASYVPFAFTSGALVAGDCVTIDGTGKYLIDAGGPCTTGGGSGTITSSSVNNVGYYSGATTINGSANFTWVNGSQHLTITGTSTSNPALTVLSGYTESAGGFTTTSSSATAIQAANGQVASKTLYASDSLLMQRLAQPALSALGQVRIYADDGSSGIAGNANRLNISINGVAFTPIATSFGTLTNGHCVSIDASGNFVDAGGACTVGGGGGTVSSAVQYQVAYYTTTGTIVGGSANYTFNAASQHLTVNGTSTSNPALTVTNGYTESAGGFTTTSSSATAIQAANGQVAAKTLFASDSLLFTQESAPALSGAGQVRIYADVGNTLRASINGAAYQTIQMGTAAGVTSLNSLTGALNIVGTANQVIVTPGGSSITLTTPQSIGTSNSPTFVSVDHTSTIKLNGTTVVDASRNFVGNSLTIGGNSIVSTAGAVQGIAPTTSSIALQTFNATCGTCFQVDGNGNISSSGSINLTGSSAYKMGGTTVIDVSRNAFLGSLSTVGAASIGNTLTVTSAITANGGINTPTGSTNSNIYIGSGGNLYLRPFSGADASCGAILNGWIGVRTDTNQLEVCIGGSVKKVTLI